MVSFSHYPLQESVYQVLAGDASLAALIVGIFDRPPQQTTFPYITLGESSGTDWSTKTTTGTEQHFTVQVWSREGGRKEAALIMERVYNVLHQADLTVEGHTLVVLHFTGSRISLENDGWTYQGIMHFRALLEASA